MKKTLIILIALFGLTLFSNVATAFNATPGSDVPLVLQDFKVTTDTPVLPDWKPQSIKWKLIDPQGNVKVVKDTGIDSITKDSQGLLETNAKWTVNTNGGFITIPAFAEPGEWKLRAVFYSRDLIFLNSEGYDVSSINVQEASMSQNLMAPVGIVLGIPFVGDVYLGLEVIYLVGIVLIVPLLYLVFRRKR